MADETPSAAERTRVFQAVLLLDEAIPDELLDDPMVEDTLDKFRGLICRTYGHWPTVDQCGLPEHDFCLVCGDRMPGQGEERMKNWESRTLKAVGAPERVDEIEQELRAQQNEQ